MAQASSSIDIALYAYRLAYHEPTGVDRYVSELSLALAERFPERYRLFSSYEKKEPGWVNPRIRFARLPGPRRALHLSWALTKRPRIDRFTGPADLLHVLVPTWPVPSRMPVVYTFHDVMPLQHPEWYPALDVWLFRLAAEDAAARARRVIAVSQKVADDVTEHMGVERERITVVYEGIGARFLSRPSADVIDAACRRVGVQPGRYLIHVARISTRKNVLVLVNALKRRGPGAPLLLVGPEGLGAEAVRAEIERLGLSDQIIRAGHVPDEDLPALIAGALALVHPSRYEGFGLTPLEAMALGTPAIASRAGSLPEILGTAAPLLDPDDADAWAGELTRVETDPDYAHALVERGSSHAARFKWAQAASETAAVHEAVVSNG
jgi:glycosyltransferase involved in cell wall biosynthesis